MYIAYCFVLKNVVYEFPAWRAAVNAEMDASSYWKNSDAEMIRELRCCPLLVAILVATGIKELGNWLNCLESRDVHFF